MKKNIKVEELNVTIKYKKNMRRVYLRVNEKGEIVVSAPIRTPNYVVKNLVLDNIEKVRNIVEKFKDKVIDENEYFIFGKKMEVIISEEKTKFIEDNNIILSVSESLNKEEFIRKELRSILLRTSEEFVEKYKRQMKVEVNELRIKKMKTRWGTCNIEKKRIWINEELIKYPIECLEHIVVHEMTHLLEVGHTPRFYKLLEKFYPSYRDNDKLLREFSKKIS